MNKLIGSQEQNETNNVFSILIWSGIFAYGKAGDLTLTNVEFQDFWINFSSILKACIDKVRWYYILHLRFNILHKMSRVTSNKEEIEELSISRSSVVQHSLFEIPTNKMLQGALLYCRPVFKKWSQL